MSYSKTILKRIHPIAGGVATILIALFFTSTIIVEIIGDLELIATLKSFILYGVCFLIPASIAAGVSGFKMLKRPPNAGPLAKKAMRMKIIGGNGLLILLPCAIALDYLASQGDFGTVFITIQAIELIAGAVNLTLMGLNMRDGLSLTKARRNKQATG